jgi:hypothetical protein
MSHSQKHLQPRRKKFTIYFRPQPNRTFPQIPRCLSHGKIAEIGRGSVFPKLGGQNLNLPQSINNRIQVVGGSDLYGDNVQHAFLWEKGMITLAALHRCRGIHPPLRRTN